VIPNSHAERRLAHWQSSVQISRSPQILLFALPALDDGFHPTLLECADELETHPLAQEDVEYVRVLGWRRGE